MNIPAGLISDSLSFWTNLASLPLLAFVAYYTPWFRMRYEQYRHLLFGSVVGLIVMWNIDAGALPALSFHYMGVMLVTLMFRWHYAIWSVLLVLLSQAFSGKISLGVVGINFLLFAVFPVYVSNFIYKLIDRYLPKHFFVYVYGAGFFGAALVTLLVVLATAFLLYADGVYGWDKLYENFVRYAPMMMFAEAFVTGMVLTLLVVFRPNWVITFSDEKYIQGK